MVYVIAAASVLICIVAMGFAWKVFRENQHNFPVSKKKKKDGRDKQ